MTRFLLFTYTPLFFALRVSEGMDYLYVEDDKVHHRLISLSTTQKDTVQLKTGKNRDGDRRFHNLSSPTSRGAIKESSCEIEVDINKVYILNQYTTIIHPDDESDREKLGYQVMTKELKIPEWRDTWPSDYDSPNAPPVGTAMEVLWNVRIYYCTRTLLGV